MAAKSQRIKIRMINKETGTFYMTTVNTRNRTTKNQGKLKLRKYDPKTRQHEQFTEDKAKG
ncbi:50S ribosomal protein L33 [Gammaproteobacteria bacterium]|nr:50S ribosomal protein L33 [Gammaproteobacteria bacterium]